MGDRRRLAKLSLLAVAVAVAGISCGPEEQSLPGELCVMRLPLDAFCGVNVTGKGVLDAENDYLPHVVQCENGGAGIEALKAQAVAARSYMYYKMERYGEIGDGQGDQVYSCGATPGQQHYDAVRATAGQVLMYNGVFVAAFYVSGADPSDRGSCVAQPQDSDPHNTERYVTYNEGRSGDGIEQSTLGWVDPGNYANRGCMSQWGSRCLEERGYGYQDILRFYYGEDIGIETASGSCVGPQNNPPSGWLDSAGCGKISGWAYDQDEKDAAIDVHLYFDGPAGSGAAGIAITAGRNRDDLCGAIGSCSHGYEMPAPLGLLDGNPHEIHAYGMDTAGGANTELSGSPKTITCNRPELPLAPGGGVLRRVKTMDVFNAWRWIQPDVMTVADEKIGQYPLGADISGPPLLGTASHIEGRVYLLDGDMKRYVTSPDVFDAWRFRTDAIQDKGAEIDSILDASEIMPMPYLLKGSGPEVYLLDRPPPFRAAIVSARAPAEMPPGGKGTVTVKARNEGTAIWKPETTKLGTTEPRGRQSVFAADSWPSAGRPAAVPEETAPGAEVEIRFEIVAPEEEDSYTECFNLVEEAVRWFSDEGQGGPPDNELCFQVEVKEGAVVIEDDDEADGGGSGYVVFGSGGCASAGGATAGMGGLVLLLAMAGALRKGRR